MKRYLIMMLTLAAAASVGAATTINPTNRFAHGANVGWMNAQGDQTNGVAVGADFCSGLAYGANIGWIHFGQGPTNGCAYSNGSKDDFGVNHDGSGGLSGFAWGANVGWLAFETNGNPRIDLSNGKMSGSIYGANIGWISLSNLHAHVQTDSIQPSPDNDGDTIPDAWEIKAVGNTNELFLGGDFDGDGVPDESEYLADSHPGDSNSFLWITLARHQSATSTLTWASRPTRQYLIETADRLTNPPAWVDTGLGLQIPTSSSTTTRAFADIVNDLKFFRVRSVLPLAP